jgi:acetyl-CoA C-acetyltransferase
VARRWSPSTRVRGAGSTLEAIAALRPLSSGGSHTAGNSPGVNDGAAAVVVASDEAAVARGLEPPGRDPERRLHRRRARAAWPGCPPWPSGIALERAGLAVADVDRFEINEAFASVALNSSRMLGADEERSTSTAVRSPSATRSEPAVRGSSSRSSTSCVASAAASARSGICSGGGQGDAMILEVPAPS